MSVSVANGVSATTAQFAEYRGTTAPTTGQVGDLWQDTSVSPPVLNQCTSISPLTWAPVATGGGGGGSGTVTSVSGTGTVSGITLSGTVTTSGSLTLGGTLAVTPSNFASQTANTFLAAPNGSSGTPSFRTVVAGDIPTLNQNTTGYAAGLAGGDTYYLPVQSAPNTTVFISPVGAGDGYLLTYSSEGGPAWAASTGVPVPAGVGFISYNTGSTARTFTAGTGISVTNGNGVSGDPVITNTAPDQTVVLTAGTGISTSGTYPNFTITNSAPDQTVVLTAGSGISITGTYPSFTITNTGGGGGGSTFTRGTATLDFGAYPGSNEASIAVTGQTSILTTSNIQAFIMGDSTSTTYTANDHKYLATLLDFSTNTATASTGFTIYARSIHKIKGTVTVNWTWV
jgi:hypothetical protein